MTLPNGHARRLFIGFSCSLMFLAAFALLVAHNTEAGPSTHSKSITDNHLLTIGIAANDPQETIDFYKKLGFRDALGLSDDIDIVCMKKDGTPYKLEIWHSQLPKTGSVSAGVSGMRFPVDDLVAAMVQLKKKGLSIVETYGKTDGVRYASLKDPNGIHIRLFER